MLKLLLAASAALAGSMAAQAQQTPADLLCEFEDGVSRADDSRATRRENAPIMLRFSAIDAARGVAQMADASASRNVAAMVSGHVVTFVEVMPSGNVTMTTVSALPTDGRRLAIHSKHVFGSLAPSYVATQYYGSCVEAE